MHIFMTKVISLSDKAYDTLKMLKRGKESFSDVVLKVTKKEKKPLLEFAGKWKNMDEMDKIFSNILERRHKKKWRGN